MIIKTIKTYEFKELKPEIKQKVLDDNREINVNDSFWYEDDGLLELSEKEIKESKIKMSKNWYEKHANIPGEYPAYTGLFKYDKFYFSIDREWYIDFVNLNVKDTEIFRKFLGIPKVLWCNCYWYFNTEPYNSTELVIEPFEKAFTDLQQQLINKAIDKMNNKIQDALKSLDRQFDYLTSDEAIIDFFENNEMLFTEKGEIYYE
jgi:hypothetical protein